MRVFLAIFPPAQTQQLAHSAAVRVREAAGAAASTVSWVKLENLHYTLSFLGELGEDGTRRAGEAASEAAGGLTAFDVALGGAGAFPNVGHARVLWLGLDRGAGEFTDLARRVEGALVKRGFDREKRPFSPHLTIGRVRNPRHDFGAALAAVPSLANESAARFRVASVRVVRSTLSPKGSIYEVVAEARLSG
ncbi:MAG: RNA 2',3'-cyclic phosphodiesterase [Candidatus Eiseniibacteriota bacterium]